MGTVAKASVQSPDIDNVIDRTELGIGETAFGQTTKQGHLATFITDSIAIPCPGMGALVTAAGRLSVSATDATSDPFAPFVWANHRSDIVNHHGATGSLAREHVLLGLRLSTIWSGRRAYRRGFYRRGIAWWLARKCVTHPRLGSLGSGSAWSTTSATSATSATAATATAALLPYQVHRTTHPFRICGLLWDKLLTRGDTLFDLRCLDLYATQSLELILSTQRFKPLKRGLD